MPYIEVAQFRFITDHPDFTEPGKPWPKDDAEGREVAAAVVEYFEEQLRSSFPQGEFIVYRVEYSFSCVYTTITVAIEVVRDGAIAAGAVVAVVKGALSIGQDYEKNLPGLRRLADHMRKATIRIGKTG